jgi:hypothetical protein
MNDAVSFSLPRQEGRTMPVTAAPTVLDDETRVELERRVRAGTRASVSCGGRGSSSRRRRHPLDPDRDAGGDARVERGDLAQAVHRRGLAGLEELLKGRPLAHDHDDRVWIAAPPAASASPRITRRAGPTSCSAEACHEPCIPVCGSRIGRILAGLELKPHKPYSAASTRRDGPRFWQRVEEVCGLYLNASENADRVEPRRDDEHPGQGAHRLDECHRARAPAAPVRAPPS